QSTISVNSSFIAACNNSKKSNSSWSQNWQLFLELKFHSIGKILQKKGDRTYKIEKWPLKTLLSTFIVTSLNSFSS
ncbi:20799_t:CDS:1, partial [Rhizophagus irregularis]